MKAATTPYRKTAQVLLIASNGIGLALYLSFASLVWAPAGQEGLLGGPGDPLIWVMLALPWLILCSFINLLAFRTVFARLILARQWLPALFLALILAAWVTAFEYDSSRHYDGSELKLETPALPVR